MCSDKQACTQRPTRILLGAALTAALLAAPPTAPAMAAWRSSAARPCPAGEVLVMARPPVIGSCASHVPSPMNASTAQMRTKLCRAPARALLAVIASKLAHAFYTALRSFGEALRLTGGRGR